MSLEEIAQKIIYIANNYGELVYLVILGWTFLEGETVVVITAALISGGDITLSVTSLVAVATLGSFGGDQTWFHIGRRYGTPLLERWPNMAQKVSWAFRLLERHPNMFILSFRFIYGVRNISPFIIGMSGVARGKFMALNLIAAVVWANTFAWGGYFVGRALETYMGDSKMYALFGLIGITATVAGVNWFRQRRRCAAAAAAAAACPVAVQEAVKTE